VVAVFNRNPDPGGEVAVKNRSHGCRIFHGSGGVDATDMIVRLDGYLMNVWAQMIENIELNNLIELLEVHFNIG